MTKPAGNSPVPLDDRLAHLRQDTKVRAQIASDKAMIEDFLRGQTPPDAVVLVDPELEAFLGIDYSFLDIERTIHRFAPVLFKFMPTNDTEILEWQWRMEFRRSTFERGCGTDPIYRRNYLLTMRDREGFLERSCGPSVFETGRFALLRSGAACR